MFINQPRTRYSKGGDLLSCTALYLLLLSDADNNLFAAVRKATLKPFGPWMAGHIVLAGAPVTVSGAFGGEGLPRDLLTLSEAQRALLTPIPPDLAETFWQGGGWNSAGREASSMREWALAKVPAMREWARANLKQLTRTRP